MTRLYFLSLLLICFFDTNAQDSTKWITNFQFELRGQHIFTYSDRSIFIDDYIQSVRRQNNPGYGQYNGLTDNPFSHYATYAGVFLNSVYQEKYGVSIGAYLEQRSFSGGSNRTSNIFLFPKIVLSVEDTLQILGLFFPVDLTVGDFYQADFNDFLRIYNVDFQGFNTSIGYKNFYVSHQHITDLAQNIGLGLHEYFRTAIYYHGDIWKAGFTFEQNWLFQTPDIDHNLGFFTRFELNKLLTIKAQWSYRRNDQLTRQNMAFGLSSSLRWKKLAIDLTGRFYQKNFNQGYYYPSLIDYRVPDNSYLGRQFYALKNYYRNVNQWALFTEYQNLDIGNLELTIGFDQRIYKKWSLKGVWITTS